MTCSCWRNFSANNYVTNPRLNWIFHVGWTKFCTIVLQRDIYPEITASDHSEEYFKRKVLWIEMLESVLLAHDISTVTRWCLSRTGWGSPSKPSSAYIHMFVTSTMLLGRCSPTVHPGQLFFFFQTNRVCSPPGTHTICSLDIAL